MIINIRLHCILYYFVLYITLCFYCKIANLYIYKMSKQYRTQVNWSFGTHVLMCTLEDYLLNYVDSITYYSLMFQEFPEKFPVPYVCAVNSMSMVWQELSDCMMCALFYCNKRVLIIFERSSSTHRLVITYKYFRTDTVYIMDYVISGNFHKSTCFGWQEDHNEQVHRIKVFEQCGG